ncbi:Chaperone DnaJ-domain superfamily protein [Raphanus sativus]|nr:Chaperone DnaJ-domain superfamily protein [Raphanus sativus]
MNAVTKTAIFRPQNYFCLLQTAFFHSTPVLERKRGFPPWAKKAKVNLNNCKQDSESTRESQFVYDDKYFEDVLFGVPPRGIYYSNYEAREDWGYGSSWYSGFCKTSWIITRRYYNNDEEVVEETDEEDPELYRLYEDEELYESEEDPELYEDEEEEESYSSSNYTNRWRSNYGFDPIEASHRETLGLSPWPPLKIEDVKHAYRNCALKWHPDRHDDSTKAEAEARFKLCTVAYQSLIQKLQSAKIS